MWLFTTDGFFSVVEHRADPSVLLVRARERSHIRRFFEIAQLFDFVCGVLEETPTADYPFRTTIERNAFAQLLARHFVSRIVYPNFKDAAHDAYDAIDLFALWFATRPETYQDPDS